MPTQKEITSKSTMQDILEAYPAAKQALFERYHIGGCSSCGFEPNETLEEVLRRANGGEANEAVELIKKTQETQEKLQVSPRELEGLLKEGKVKLLDVREEHEHRMVHIEGDQLATQELVDEIFEKWSKNTPIVLYCHKGVRSLQAAANLTAQGLTNVRSVRGGIDAWSEEIDPLLPRY